MQCRYLLSSVMSVDLNSTLLWVVVFLLLWLHRQQVMQVSKLIFAMLFMVTKSVKSVAIMVQSTLLSSLEMAEVSYQVERKVSFVLYVLLRNTSRKTTLNLIDLLHLD